MSEERRSGVRQTAKGNGRPATLEWRGREIPVLVTDESMAGAGLVAVNVADLALGSRVHFVSSLHVKECRIASVRARRS